MEQWRCVRINFFKGKLWNVGEIVSGEAEEIPRHFKSVTSDRVGKFGEREKEDRAKEPKINLEEIMEGSPLLEKAKNLRIMNKAELCALGRTLGIEFNAEETTRAEMIKEIVELKDKRGTTNQELADVVKR